MESPDGSKEDPEQGDRGAGADRAPLWILFLAAAFALVLLLTVVGLLAFVAMSPRSPADLRDAASGVAGQEGPFA